MAGSQNGSSGANTAASTTAASQVHAMYQPNGARSARRMRLRAVPATVVAGVSSDGAVTDVVVTDVVESGISAHPRVEGQVQEVDPRVDHHVGDRDEQQPALQDHVV